MRFISYAQNYEDVILWRVLKNVENGTYVDVGANDPVIDSVTKAFYDRGWAGVNIEPVKYWFDKLCLDRPKDCNYNVAASSESGVFKFYEVPETGLSTFNERIAQSHKENNYSYNEIEVEAKTLTQICIESNIPNIHFLKIDVEGHEKQVLEGFDFSIYRPWIVLIESNKPLLMESYNNEWESILIKNNYEFCYYDGLNKFYVDSTKKEIYEKIKIPPNIFDDFELYRDFKIKKELESQINNLYNSLSWRCTKPFRVALRPIKKFFFKRNSSGS